MTAPTYAIDPEGRPPRELSGATVAAPNQPVTSTAAIADLPLLLSPAEPRTLSAVPVAATEWFGTLARAIYDFGPFGYARLFVNVATAGPAGSGLVAQYWNTTAGAWQALGAAQDVRVALDQAGTLVGPAVQMPSGLAGDILLRVVTVGGNDVADVSLAAVRLQFLPGPRGVPSGLTTYRTMCGDRCLGYTSAADFFANIGLGRPYTAITYTSPVSWVADVTAPNGVGFLRGLENGETVFDCRAESRDLWFRTWIRVNPSFDVPVPDFSLFNVGNVDVWYKLFSGGVAQPRIFVEANNYVGSTPARTTTDIGAKDLLLDGLWQEIIVRENHGVGGTGYTVDIWKRPAGQGATKIFSGSGNGAPGTLGAYAGGWLLLNGSTGYSGGPVDYDGYELVDGIAYADPFRVLSPLAPIAPKYCDDAITSDHCIDAPTEADIAQSTDQGGDCDPYVAGYSYEWNGGLSIVADASAPNGTGQVIQHTGGAGWAQTVVPASLSSHIGLLARVKFSAASGNPVAEISPRTANAGVGPRFQIGPGYLQITFVAWSTGNDIRDLSGLAATVNDGATWWDLYIELDWPAGSAGPYTSRVALRQVGSTTLLIDESGSEDSSYTNYGCPDDVLLFWSGGATGGQMRVDSWKLIDRTNYPAPF